MKFVLLSVGLVGAAILSKPSPAPQAAPQAAPQTAPQSSTPIGSKQIADSKSSKIADFLSSMQNRVSRSDSRAVIAKANGAPPTNKSSGNRLSRRQRRAVERSARKDARRDIVARDPEAEEVFSGSASVSFEASCRHTDHFSFSESEHFRDCSTTSSSSSGKPKKGGCNKDKKKKKKVGYRLRHIRVHAEESRARKNDFSASASASIDLGDVDVSGSLSASAEFKRSRTTVLRCCEDELSRRRKHHHRRSGACDPYVRVDYRKKVYYNDDAEKRFSVSLSGSLSIEEERTATVTDVAKPTGAP